MAPLPETSIETSLEAAERLRAALSETEILTENGEAIRFTVNIGVAQMNDADTKLEDVLTRADEALYRAKEAGRDRVIPAD